MIRVPRLDPEELSVPALLVLVDYDNVDRSHTVAGPVSLAKMLVTLLPYAIITRHQGVTVRLYGGWRSNGTLTNFAQNLVPDIHCQSPTVVSVMDSGVPLKVRLTVELAQGPIGSSSSLEQTFVKNRGLRNFRSRSSPRPECVNSSSCGLQLFSGLTHATQCGNPGCNSKLADVFVRDEQKMVDTLIVADIAHQAFAAKATDVVVVSSDTDMWPGVLLALRAGCAVTHIHTKHGLRTQQHLMNTLGGKLSRNYQQLSV